MYSKKSDHFIFKRPCCLSFFSYKVFYIIFHRIKLISNSIYQVIEFIFQISAPVGNTFAGF